VHADELEGAVAVQMYLATMVDDAEEAASEFVDELIAVISHDWIARP
jgi:hypothetical protein